MQYSWTCGCCGKHFDTLPMGYAAKAPHNWFRLPEAERETRAKLSTDLCIIDREEFYIRGCIEVPVLDCDENFIWGVWVSVSEESFWYIFEKWDDPIADDEPARFGWLCTWLRGYPDPHVHEIKCQVHLRAANLRPRIVLEPTDYPLAVEQREGITLERVKAIFASREH